MARADGYIRIDTKINQTGAKTGMAQLTKSLKGFAAAMGVAFGVAAIVKFGKAAIKVASDLVEVQNVVSVTFKEATDQINEFAKTAARGYGLSELAAKRYTGTMGAMLKSMGFGTQAAANMSIEMAKLAGDMASFYNLTTDEAFAKIRSGISGETEPLKQLGVNLSVANLEQYALTQGIKTGYNALTEQNKALLRYNYLLDVTADAQGDFARTSNTWANQIKVVGLQFETLKTTLGGAFITVLTPVLRMVNQLLGSLNAAAVVFANFIAAVTGTQQQVTTGAGAATEAIDGIADSSDEAAAAAKEAQKSLQGFDELNVMKAPDAGAGGAGADIGLEATTTTTAMTEAAVESVNPMQERLAEFFTQYRNEIDRIKASWESIKQTTGGVWTTIKSQLERSNIGGAFQETVLNFVYRALAEINLLIGIWGKLIAAFDVPATVEAGLLALSGLFKAIGDAITAVTPGIFAFIDKGLAPIAKWIGGKIRDAFGFLLEQFNKIGAWFQTNEEKFTALGTALGETAGAIWEVIAAVGDAVWETAKAAISGLVDTLLTLADWALEHQETVSNIAIVVGSFTAAVWLANTAVNIWTIATGIATGVMTAFGAVLAFITSPIGLVVLAIAAIIAITLLCIKYWDEIKEAAVQIWTAIAGFFTGIWNGIKAGAIAAWEGLKGAWGAAAAWFRERVIAPLGAAFDGFKKKFEGIWDSIGKTVKGAVNFMIDLINKLIVGVNKFKIDIPPWVSKIPGLGDYGGKSIGFNIPKIPRLAQGAVIPPNREFVALLGDQRSGTNIETPLDTMIQAFKAALSDMGPTGQTDVKITFNGELAALAQILAPTITTAQNAANRAAGRTLQTI